MQQVDDYYSDGDDPSDPNEPNNQFHPARQSRKLTDPVSAAPVTTYPNTSAERKAQADDRRFRFYARELGKSVEPRRLNDPEKPFDPEVSYVRKPKQEEIDARNDRVFQQQMQRYAKKAAPKFQVAVQKAAKCDLELEGFAQNLVLKVKFGAQIFTVKFGESSTSKQLLEIVAQVLQNGERADAFELRTVDGAALDPEAQLVSFNKKALMLSKKV